MDELFACHAWSGNRGRFEGKAGKRARSVGMRIARCGDVDQP